MRAEINTAAGFLVEFLDFTHLGGRNSIVLASSFPIKSTLLPVYLLAVVDPS